MTVTKELLRFSSVVNRWTEMAQATAAFYLGTSNEKRFETCDRYIDVAGILRP